MGDSGRFDKTVGVDKTPQESDRFSRVTTMSQVTPYQLGRLKVGEYIESDYDGREYEPSITHGETDLTGKYSITKNKGNSYTVRWSNYATGSAFTSSMTVSKAGLEAFLRRMRRGNEIKMHYANQVKTIR